MLVAFTVYLIGLLVWLALGLVPMHVAAPDMSHELLDATTGLQTAVEYFFSFLNLTLGVLLFLRRPNDLVPGLLAFALLGTAATFNLPSHRAFHITGSPWPIAAVHFTFHIVSGVAYVWAVVLFPDGSLPSRIRLPRWAFRALVVGTTAAIALLCWRSSFLDHPRFFVVFFGIAVALLGVGAQTLRIRDPATTSRDRATARLLRAALLPALAVAVLWLGAGTLAGLLGTGGAAGTVNGGAALQTTVEKLFPAVFAVVPVVLFAGVIRYRLWDIDRLLGRVLVYGLLVVALGAVYVTAVATGGRVAGGGLWFTAAALSVAAVLIEPLRVVGRRWANRVVFGQRLSPTEAAHALADSLEHLTPATELAHVAAVTVAATRAAAAELWLLQEDRLVPAAGAPDGIRRPGEVLLAGDDRSVPALVAAVDAQHGWPIRHQGELLGLLAVRAPAGERLSSADDAVGADIAAHAGLLVHNATLTATLARQVQVLAEHAAQLTTSRRRLVAAQDTERRILERALHDGAQQALVAAIIGARAGADSGGLSHAERDELRTVLQAAQRDIDELSGDGQPGVLHRLGLAGGLARAAALARRGGLTVDLQLDPGVTGTDRSLPGEVATAVYFACVEGLQNVSKYAHAQTATVSVSASGDEVRFSVIDDGTGIDPVGSGLVGSGVVGDAPAGARDDHGGLTELSRRLAALGGDVTITRRPQGGTALLGSIPAQRTNGGSS